jgi:hypothetical protein
VTPQQGHLYVLDEENWIGPNNKILIWQQSHSKLTAKK